MSARLTVCLTPDERYMRPALATAASLLAQSDADGIEILILCEADDVPAGFHSLAPALRERITVLPVDWRPHVADLPTRGHFSSAVNRRLALHRVLPDRVERYVSMDADMRAVRPGMAALAALDLGGHAIAAAYDMIFWKDLEEGPLTAEFRAYRAALGLAPETPYFNNGLTLVDRAAWTKSGVAEAAAERLRSMPERHPFLEQSALNAVVQGRFAPLSPRYNFMGDFLLLDVAAVVQPVIEHYVNKPKPWEAGFAGTDEVVGWYRRFFASSPWPSWMPGDGAPLRPDQPHDPQRFRARLLERLRAIAFVDRPAFTAGGAAGPA